jgi:predicted RNA binding protein YcfA (HicA-like mRNA interferase family)
MAILPALSGREVVRIFEADGWNIARQRGSHVISLRMETSPRSRFQIIVKWPKELYGVIRASGLTRDEFISLIGK